MTVINMLSLGEEGIAVADEQASSYLRKYNIAQKLHPLITDKIIYGGSGPIDFTAEVYEISKEKIKELNQLISLRDAYSIVEETLMSLKNSMKNKLLKANLGVSLEDFLTGSLVILDKKLGEDVKTRSGQILQHFEEISAVQILIGGLESEKFSIYNINSNGMSIKTSQPYSSIGSGSDESEKILSTYVSLLPRDKRDKIERVDGLAKAIEATNASERLNVGVGGTISIAHITKDKIVMPDENRCRLASEIVQGLTLRLLEKSQTYEMLDYLIFKNEDFDSVMEEFKNKVNGWENLDMILRGYKF